MYAREAVERIYQEGFSTQAMTERLEGATEMERREIERQMQRDSQLITGIQFASDSERFRQIELGHRPSQPTDATLTFNIDGTQKDVRTADVTATPTPAAARMMKAGKRETAW